MFKKLFKKKSSEELSVEIPMAPGTNGYASIQMCPYCKKEFVKTSLYCDHCGKQVFEK